MGSMISSSLNVIGGKGSQMLEFFGLRDFLTARGAGEDAEGKEYFVFLCVFSAQNSAVSVVIFKRLIP